MSNDMLSNFGWIAIIPPVIAVLMALITKEVITSLLLGIFSGALILSNGNILDVFTIMSNAMSNKVSNNANILIFLGLVGILVTVISKAGGSSAYGSWAAKKIRSRKGILTATSMLGCMMFIDDYFNCLTVGSVMRPVTDKHKISRVKLAYIIDTIASSICILVPISSWGALIGAYIYEANIGNGMSVFIKSIPYNFYAILSILMVLIVCFFDLNIGTMKKFEQKALTGDLSAEFEPEIKHQTSSNKSKGKVYDLLIPILSLIVCTILVMIQTGGGFSGKVPIMKSFGECNSSLSLVTGSFISLIVAFFLYIPRKIMSFKDFISSVSEGIKSMVSAFVILILAWTISEICSASYLNTGGFVAKIVQTSPIHPMFLPLLVFVLSGFLGFATGTSWGTMAILIPVCGAICQTEKVSPFLLPILGAILAGSVLGDHVSPISDTTILSSTGSQCSHLDHVSTQLLYAVIVAFSSCVGYILTGFFQGYLIPFIFAFASLIIMTIVCVKLSNKKL